MKRICALLIAIVGGSAIAAALCLSTPSPHSSRVAALQSALQNGMVQIPFTPVSGYLNGVLSALKVPVESQVAVFSRTSAQGDLVSPDNPRVIYFSDDIAVGWVRGSKVIEVEESDANSGVVFYTIPQDDDGPHFVRNDGCRSCHESGLLVLSTPDAYGNGARTAGTPTDHRTPLEQRWGGWYVTGRSSGWRHLGNRVGQGWLVSLYDQFDDTGYPSRYSDAVALMVLEHQAHLTNLLTVLSKEVNGGASRSDVNRRVQEVVDYILFVNEAPLPARLIGTSGFTQYFSSIGPRDSRGRSLRDFELNRRLFQYPCSYMIYSDTFNTLPATAKNAIYAMLFDRFHHRGAETCSRF
jgi:hypothetical protein